MKPLDAPMQPAVLAQRWRALAARERAGLVLAAVLVAGAMLWWLGVAPALQALRTAKAVSPALDAQLQSMQSLATEASSLNAQRKLSYDETLKALELSMKTLGSGATLAVTEARATVNIRSTSGDALASWLAQVRSNARLVPAELRLKKTTAAADSAVSWDGSVVFSLGSRP